MLSAPDGVPTIRAGRCERSLYWRARLRAGGGHRLAQRLGEHEPDVLLDDLELLDGIHAALAEEVHEPLDQLFGCARARGDADGPLALEPRLVDLRLVVDQVRLGPELARALDEPVRVRRVARPDDEHEVALRRHLLDGRLAIGRRVADVVGARTGDGGELLAQAVDDR